MEFYGELTAAEEDLTLSYQLLKYGEEGRTNIGRITVPRGSLSYPEDPRTLLINEQHDRDHPIGHFTRLIETPEGLQASVKLFDSPAGRKAYAEAKDGTRPGISIEANNLKIRNGILLAGHLECAGLVVSPAYPSSLLVASDQGELSEKENTVEETSLTAAEETSAFVPPVQAEPVLNASLSGAAQTPGDFILGTQEQGVTLTAALAEVHTDFDPAKVYLKDQDLGELWSARRVARPIAESFYKGEVTSLTLTGTRRTRVTKVATWNGNRVELPTSPGFTTSREYWSPTHKAVALGLSYEILAFGDSSVINDIYADAVDDYMAQTEQIVVTKLVNDAPAVSAATGAIAAVNKAADTMTAIGANLDFVLVSPDVHAFIRDISASNAPWWLQNQGKVLFSDSKIVIEGGPIIVSSAALPAKTIIAGDKRAIDFREAADFKASAYNLVVHGQDINLVKSYALKTLDPNALIKFTNVTGA